MQEGRERLECSPEKEARSMLHGLAHLLVQYVIGSFVVAFLLVPCLMARSVDLSAEDLPQEEGLGDGV